MPKTCAFHQGHVRGRHVVQEHALDWVLEQDPVHQHLLLRHRIQVHGQMWAVVRITVRLGCFVLFASATRCDLVRVKADTAT
jgi:hypothetical protein